MQKEIKGLTQQPQVLSHSIEHLHSEFRYSYKGDGKYGKDWAVS